MCLKDFYQLPRQVDEQQIIINNNTIFRLKISWQDQPRLQIFIDQLSAEISESQLIIYLLLQLRDHPTDITLIKIWQCWLYKCCQKVADERYNRLKPFLPNSYTIKDLFQDCYLLITNPVDFFSKFDIEKSQSLKSWSIAKIKNLWLKKIRKAPGNNNISVTNLGLAVGSSRKKWLEIATNDNEKAQYGILYQCVAEFRNSTNLSCDKWKDKEFREISDRYNQLIKKHELTETEIIEILDNIGGEIRLLRQPREISGDANIGDESEGEMRTLFDMIDDTEQLNDQEQLLESHQEVEILINAINQIFNNLDAQNKQISYFYFCLGYTQQQTAEKLGGTIDYTTVGRRVNKIFRDIVLLCHSQIADQKSLKSEDVKYKYPKNTINKLYEQQLINFCPELD